ncbi:hypothetical protein RPMA_05360 [Tardiphaga alba]|uniref:Uncharacterized protein n=1 Tax=Tardiphaga alba TaxID=340268 RepID=A0ABX8A7D7_9BRAD|nr:hypothetical protein [Tardiphaga alba]QUS38335.1 hypothetical protein RPMA_05360 [Tardiphaga alba]
MIAVVDRWIAQLRHFVVHSDSGWAAISSLVLLFLPVVVAYWKGQGNIRFGALPLTLLALVFMITTLDVRSALFLWFLAWLCVALSFVKLPRAR